MQSNTIIRKILFPLIGSLGYRISPISNLKELGQFINKLHPIKFDLIRLGSSGDGGYLVPNDLDGIKYCFSPGVSDNSDFENDLSKRGIASFLADFSVDEPAIANENFTFLKKFVGTTNSEKVIEFEEWVSNHSLPGDELLLQMDIEGSEYASLLSCSQEILTRFRILIIEFHGLDLMFDVNGFLVLREFFDKLLQDYFVVHIHPNNNDPIRRIGKYEIPSLMEFSFIRKDRVSSLEYETVFPHVLDQSTVATKRDVKLPRIWYRREV